MKISSNYLNKILSFLIILFLPAMITGPLIPEILMNVSILIFLILVFSEKKFYYFKNVYSYFFLLFYIYINIRSLFVDDLFFSLKSTLFYFRFYIFSLAIWFTMETNKNFLKKFVITLLSITIFLIIDGIIQYKFGANLLGWEKYHPTRVSSFFGDELIFGNYLSRSLSIAIGLYVFLNFDNFNFNKTLFLFFFICLTYLGILISGDRTGFYLSLLFLPFLLSLKKIDYLKNKIIPIIIIFLSIISFTILVNEDLKKRLIVSTFKSIITFDKIEKIPFIPLKKDKFELTIFTPNHEVHVKTALNMFKHNKIFGVGVKQYRKLCKDDKYFVNRHSCVTHPHNTYAQFLAELGIIGFIFISIFFIFILYKIYKSIFFEKNNNIYFLNIIILGGIFINLFPLAPSGNFFNNWTSMLFYAPLGFYFFTENKIRQIN